MDRTELLHHLRVELDTFAQCLTGDLTAPVAHCHGWTLHDLAEHLGRGNLWAAAAVTELSGDNDTPAAPRRPDELRTWFAATAQRLLAVLDVEPSTPAWTFAPPRTVAFWQRRRCQETLVHRWDAQHALGIVGAVDPVLAADGVAEVADVLLPRQVRLGRAEALPYAVGLAATDTARSWVLGSAEPVAVAEGRAADLLLMLWGRLPVDDPAISWQGDLAAARIALDRPIVP